MEMIKSRNESSHMYDSEIVGMIIEKITTKFHPAFVAFKIVMEQKIKL